MDKLNLPSPTTTADSTTNTNINTVSTTNPTTYPSQLWNLGARVRQKKIYIFMTMNLDNS